MTGGADVQELGESWTAALRGALKQFEDDELADRAPR